VKTGEDGKEKILRVAWLQLLIGEIIKLFSPPKKSEKGGNAGQTLPNPFYGDRLLNSKLHGKTSSNGKKRGVGVEKKKA